MPHVALVLPRVDRPSAICPDENLKVYVCTYCSWTEFHPVCRSPGLAPCPRGHCQVEFGKKTKKSSFI